MTAAGGVPAGAGRIEDGSIVQWKPEYRKQSDDTIKDGFAKGMRRRGISGDFAKRIYAEFLNTRDQELGYTGGYVIDYPTDEDLHGGSGD